MLSNPVYSVNVAQNKGLAWMRDLILIVIASGLISLSGFLAIKLPFTPVPITLAHNVCLALGLLLGRKRGALAVVAYLFQGAMGFPVFAAGHSGLLYLLGPTGGYLIGWVAGAYLTGYLIEKSTSPTAIKKFLAVFAGNGLIYLFGFSHLALFIGWKSAFLMGILPFVCFDLIKSFVIAKGIPTQYLSIR